jgi:hypothetical protein
MKNGYADYLPNYTGDPVKCLTCKIQMKNFDKLFVVDLNNDGVDTFLYCSEKCYKKTVTNTP